MASRSSSALVTTALATATRIPQPRNATRTMVPTRRNSSLHSLLAAPSTCETCFANTTETDLVPTIFSVTSIGATWYVPEETYYISGGGFSNYVSFQPLCCGSFCSQTGLCSSRALFTRKLPSPPTSRTSATPTRVCTTRESQALRPCVLVMPAYALFPQLRSCKCSCT